jgi:hypothetical protein
MAADPAGLTDEDWQRPLPVMPADAWRDAAGVITGW